ncbi:MAG TPA: Uma2 family endonuclease [Kofleriaceae bacterium]|nr:Uma2 family endonuclease [Kofleriaceae bacterium]
MPSSGATHDQARWPPVDARLAAPETRYEIDDGVLVPVSPADESHGTRHAKISALIEAHAGTRFRVASDMLTRTSTTSDIAPDVSVFPRARNPRTGGRRLEQLAFEVVSTQSLSHAARKAAKLTRRGVRRVFAIDVEREQALEWSQAKSTWRPLDRDTYILDPTLAAPLPVRDLVSAARADNAIVRAMIAKRNPVIAEVRANARRRGKREGLAEGKREGLATALLGIFAVRGIALKPADRTRIAGERDPEQLRRWIARAATSTSVIEVFGRSRSDRPGGAAATRRRAR